MGRYAILTICTANICRSPLMETLLRRLGSDTGEFRSRPLTAKIVESADLILTAAYENTAPAVLSVSSTRHCAARSYCANSTHWFRTPMSRRCTT